MSIALTPAVSCQSETRAAWRRSCAGLPAVLLGMLLAMAAPSAMAQDSTAYDAAYQQALRECDTRPEDSRAACHREAAAARQESLLGLQTPDNGAAYRLNRQNRCERLPVAQRDDCLRLMSDQQASSQGSVQGGGILRELVITVPGEPAPADASRPTAPSPPIPPTPAQPLPIQ